MEPYAHISDELTSQICIVPAEETFNEMKIRNVIPVTLFCWDFIENTVADCWHRVELMLDMSSVFVSYVQISSALIDG